MSALAKAAPKSLMDTTPQPAPAPEAKSKIALTMRETCHQVCLCRSTIERMVSTGEFPKPRRIRGRILFSESEVRQWFEKQPKVGG